MYLYGHLTQRPELEDLNLRDESFLIENALRELESLEMHRDAISTQAKKWIESVRQVPLQPFNIQRFLQAFPLTHDEGRSLMSLSEAFLRIPDSYTASLLLKDKLNGRTWHKQNEDKLTSLSRWGLDLINYIQNKSWGSHFEPVMLRTFKVFMRLMSREFILGQTIEEAVKRSQKTPEDRFSFDMLGEGARTFSIAKAYKASYLNAIEVLGKQKNQGSSPYEKNSISVKLSALHPHYNLAHREEVMRDLLPILIELCVFAKDSGIALTIDAEEVARLELSLDLIQGVSESNELKTWDGFGLAVQAYQKRAPAVIDWVERLSRSSGMPFMVRLVKGAYWDTEIKIAQVGGYPNYPVFTRKAATDLSYLACAQKLLEAEGRLYPQFGTHNAYTIAAILKMAGRRTDIEFQRLQGMGAELFKAVLDTHSLACRVYAPVGNDKDLLAYLVRRLLENGANSSFIHKIYDTNLSPDEILGDPWRFFENHELGPHPKIPLPKDIYGKSRINSLGYDLNDKKTLQVLKHEIEGVTGNRHGEEPFPQPSLRGGPKVRRDNPFFLNADGLPRPFGPRNDDLLVLEKALETASSHAESWDLTPATKRAEILYRAADLLEEQKGLFLRLLIDEGKKTLPDAISELREAIDFCRYYAMESLKHFAVSQTLQGPTGELNQLILRGRGVFACISPWNFPLAIFMGQVTAALAAGNAVVAKPASLTPRIAFQAVEVLCEAGVPREILHLIHGPSRLLGIPLVADSRIKGVVFTGSTSTAQHINRNLAERGGEIVPFIAETGGINTMIVDSSALIEQVVDDVISSAFQSAGQRCSALRILCIQDDIYDATLQMLREAMEALNVGNPALLSTDVGPVIDKSAYDEIESYISQHLVYARTRLPDLKGNYIAPTLIEVGSIKDVSREVFGPVLHVSRFKAQELEELIRSINHAGYGLTMGVQSRIDQSIKQVRSFAHAGNLYVNRNIIGAVVGVQPFGGEGLSGTGPKAGGPYYLPRFAVERTYSDNIMASGGNISLLNLEE